ncbi:lysylphosphatidylglycerol synthase domain-containing protein [Geminocystis sp. NIES-3709]|uniref:lysylphosphatidylglycerol synthase domain-containing protein n=1 Tax=Geminocystis sp. NIES-3709 TaxID=1617448 RepID=UPI0005FC6997|nr:lysylphosphatidylglycerol synthase domain-containing protein [Geminocystis sp. NIES-3709]BAQ66543.1 membrane protein [Geminocystis sp. NIES-3709]
MIKNFRQIIPILFVIILFSISIMAIVSELKKDSIESVWLYLKNIPHWHKVVALVMTILGYGLMTGYDLLGFSHIRQKLSPFKIAFTAFVSYAVGNTIGFTAFSGTAIRYHYYGLWGISKIKIGELIIFTHLTFWLGLLTISGVVSLLDPLTLPSVIKLPFKSIHPLGYIFLSLVIIYFIVSVTIKHSFNLGEEEITFPKPKISVGTIIIAALDWGLAAGVLYLLLPVNSAMSYISFFGIYIIALTAGLISTVPGGLGVFETIMLYLRPQSVSSSDMLGGLIAYRIVYFFIPLIVALALIGIQAWKKTNKIS